MVIDYKSEINKIDKLNRSVNFVKVKKVLIHLEALKYPNYELSITNYKYGLVLNPEDEVKSNWSTIINFPTVQIMSVNPGFQGTPFLPETLNKINELRKLGFKGTISLDGAINDKTLSIILKNKYLPDILFPGSYLREKTKERLKILQRTITQANPSSRIDN
jgi:pentose-5-phosphate-3-epimerase